MSSPQSDEPGTKEFTETDLRGARFVGADLSGVVMRGVELAEAELDSPWLFEAGSLLVNGVNVIPLVDAELNRRFGGRAERRAEDPEGLRAAWERLQHAWATVLERVAAMPPGTVDVSVDGEWSFAQTLRHLIFATDIWLGRAILAIERFHPVGQVDTGTAGDGFDTSTTAARAPSYDEVLTVRAGRVAMVGEFLATVTPDLLAETRPNPHAPEHGETVLSCLHTIFEEEWEHHRYAVRDLDAIAATDDATGRGSRR